MTAIFQPRLAVLMLAAALRLHGQAPDWRAAARGDLDAARALLRDNHPAAQPLLRDRQFMAALDSGYRDIAALAERVTDAGGYRAALRRFANQFGDPHIRASFTERMPGAQWRWPGFTVRYSGDRFRVAVVDSSVSGIKVGDQVISCDGVPIAQLARRRVGGYRAVWSIRADIVRTAFYQFVDDENPFEPLATSCQFSRQRRAPWTLPLRWSPTDATALGKHLLLSAGYMGQRPMGTTMRDNLYWIAMSHMGSDADSMLRDVAAAGERLDTVRAIVIDLRGNGGGSSSKGEEMMTSLFGERLMLQSRAALGSASGSHWRATPFVLQSLQAFAANRTERYGEQSEEARGWRAQADSVQRAIDSADDFWPTLPAWQPERKFREPRRHNGTGRVRKTVVLTDHLCFSSCLMFVAQLRAIGVTQIGSATNASRRYMEVRDSPLPSGLATFSTLQKVSLGAPDWFGPYEPDITLPPGIDTPEAVEGWAARVALRRSHSRTQRPERTDTGQWPEHASASVNAGNRFNTGNVRSYHYRGKRT